LLLYIVSLISIFFDSQIRFILQSKKESRRTTNINKIIIDRKDAENRAKEIENKTETKNIETNAEIVATIATTTTNKKNY